VYASDLKFVIFRDMKDGGGYRWRLSSAAGETLERSERGHPHNEPKTQSRRRRSMSATDLKLVVFRDLKDSYKWRLRSTRGETI
jgi:uncharacterized protein YegP (UPF0339 family)